MSEKLESKTVNEKPKKRIRRDNLYDILLDAFFEVGEDHLNVNIEGKDPDFLMKQLNMKIEARSLDDKVRTFKIGRKIYLSRCLPMRKNL